MVTILGITGGIGSGKTYVANIMKRIGISIYFADIEAKSLMNTSKKIIFDLTREFGEEVFFENKVNYKYLANIVFSDKEKLEKLNSIVHPEVKKDFKNWVNNQKDANNIIAVETAILFESGFDELVNKILLIDADIDTRIERVMKRDSCTTEQVKSRIKNQTNVQFLLKKSDFIVDTNENNLILPQIVKIINTVRNGQI
jgi:dephospho-CoA kinase